MLELPQLILGKFQLILLATRTTATLISFTARTRAHSKEIQTEIKKASTTSQEGTIRTKAGHPKLMEIEEEEESEEEEDEATTQGQFAKFVAKLDTMQ